MDLIHKARLCNSEINFLISSLSVEAYLVNLSLGNLERRLSSQILRRNTMKGEHFQNNLFFVLWWSRIVFLLGTFPSNCFGVNGSAVPWAALKEAWPEGRERLREEPQCDEEAKKPPSKKEKKIVRDYLLTGTDLVPTDKKKVWMTSVKGK